MQSREVTYDPKFTAPKSNNDVLLCSSDMVYFCVPAFVLKSATGLFRSMLSSSNSSSAIPISAPSRILKSVLLIVSGLPPSPSTCPFHFTTITDLEEALYLLIEWDAPGPICIIRGSLLSYVSLYDSFVSLAYSGVLAESEEDENKPPMISTEPVDKGGLILRLYALASRMGWEEESRALEKCTIGVDIWSDKYVRDLRRMEGRAIMRLVRLRKSRRDIFVSSWNVPASRCEHRSYEDSVAELKSKAFWEMDKHPRGDTLLDSLEMDEWVEAVTCWGLKCENCGAAAVDRMEVLKDVRRILAQLPCTA